MEDNIQKTKDTYATIYQAYATNNKSLTPVVRRMAVRFREYLSGKDVLDIGCAAGKETKYFHDKGLNVSGCDISEEFIRLAKKTYPECDFFVADMRNIDTHGKLFDGIWASASFLHLPKSFALNTLKSFTKKLKNNGVLYISVMKGEFDGLRPNSQMNWPERHFSDYSKEEMTKLLSDAKFSIINFESTPTNWGPTFLHFFCRKI